MDGTLIDSMPYHWKPGKYWTLRQINSPREHACWNQTVGMRNSEIIPLLFPDMSPEQADSTSIEAEGSTLPRTDRTAGRIGPAARRGRLDSALSSCGLETGGGFIGAAPKTWRPSRTCCTSTATFWSADLRRRCAARQTRSRYLSRRRRSLERPARSAVSSSKTPPAGHRSRAPGRHESHRRVEYACRSWKPIW